MEINSSSKVATTQVAPWSKSSPDWRIIATELVIAQSCRGGFLLVRVQKLLVSGSLRNVTVQKCFRCQSWRFPGWRDWFKLFDTDFTRVFSCGMSSASPWKGVQLYIYEPSKLLNEGDREDLWTKDERGQQLRDKLLHRARENLCPCVWRQRDKLLIKRPITQITNRFERSGERGVLHKYWAGSDLTTSRAERILVRITRSRAVWRCNWD